MGNNAVNARDPSGLAGVALGDFTSGLLGRYRSVTLESSTAYNIGNAIGNISAYALIAVDVVNTPFSPGPDVGLAGAARLTAGGGARVESLTASEITRIQNAANRTQTEINLVGSRASGITHAGSDWDYLINANSQIRGSVKSSLPGAGNVGEGIKSTVDIFQGTLNTSKPFITFTPF